MLHQSIALHLVIFLSSTWNLASCDTLIELFSLFVLSFDEYEEVIGQGS